VLDSPVKRTAARKRAKPKKTKVKLKALAPIDPPTRPPISGEERAERVIRFIQTLTVPSGTGHGYPFVLMDWQKRFIRDIYAPNIGGRRTVRRAILSIARKNGKTATIAALVLAHLVGPEAVRNGEIYSAANDRDQAAIVYKFARQMVELEPDLKAKIQVVGSTKTMIGRATGSVYRAVSREAGTKHGLLPSVVIYDELAQAKSRILYDVLDTSFGARDEPLFIAISTQSNDPEHILSKLIDDGLSGADPSIICHLYAADDECDLADETQWRKANPALGVFRDREDLATAIRKAMRMPAEEPKVRNLFLNQRVAQTAPLISRAEWSACAGDAEIADREDVYLGLDLSSVNDLTACVMVTVKEPIRVRPFFWKPRESIIDQSKRDFGAGSHRYLEWADDDWLMMSSGKTIDHAQVARFIVELYQRYRIKGLAYDRYAMSYVRGEFDRIGFATHEDDEKRGSGLRMVAWGQGYASMGPAVDAFERAILEGKLVHPDSPVLNWNVSNAVSTMDAAGNRKIDKDKARFRVDGAVALAMALGLRAKDRAGQPVFDVYALIG
jgi:phage terminase large subunit-like protein